ncbi:hypothetical protein NO559_16420 [Dasania sp. GY-MA-18]|uniref:hypothetical protein n=1 Tax=Dasania sp. GY-MA-18 TaxID=2966584 RepID=UPI0021AC6E38|nr:hypothetical protein [Dasania sp. GY-MA-18]MCR8924359.1 hypothetical protein [Dasania sp. GY-MA-18]
MSELKTTGREKPWTSEDKLFRDVTLTHKQWLAHSLEHLYTAELLLPHVKDRFSITKSMMMGEVSRDINLPPSVTSPYFFHCAIAIENAFKSVICVKHKDNIHTKMTQKPKIPKVLLGHDLYELSTRAGYTSDEESEYNLQFLTEFGIWSGKYPLPMSNDHYGRTKQFSDGKHYFVSGFATDTVPDYFKFGIEIYKWSETEVKSISTAYSEAESAK